MQVTSMKQTIKLNDKPNKCPLCKEYSVDKFKVTDINEEGDRIVLEEYAKCGLCKYYIDLEEKREIERRSKQRSRARNQELGIKERSYKVSEEDEIVIKEAGGLEGLISFYRNNNKRN